MAATELILQLLSFGYLLESGGRVARTGRLRDGLGSMAIGCRLVLLPSFRRGAPKARRQGRPAGTS
ncbi:MAG TPA: hypothetical protein VKP69_03540 [Isosphaeraceae bacterium]|nr:hypothetical protein [Isosphaeraceae bacterium]